MNTKFKKTELGEIPEEWDIKKVSEFADVVGGGTPSTKDSSNFDGNIPWITPKDLSGWGYKRISKGERSIAEKALNGAKLLPKNSVLLTSRAPVGYVAIADNPVTTNQGFKSLIPKKNADSDFLYYLLKNNIERLKNNASGSTFQELSGGVLKQMKFGLPKIKVQQQISSVLSSLDDKVELNNKTNITLENIVQTLFTYWFSKFEFPNEKSEPYKSCGGEMCESEVGLIPYNWTIKELTQIVLFNPLEHLKKGSESKYLEMKELSESGMWCFSDHKKEYNGGTKFRNGDTLMARITPCLENGKTGYVNFLQNDEIAFGSTEYIIFRAKDDIFSEYIYCLVRSSLFRDKAIKSMIGSSGRQRVQTDTLMKCKIATPPQYIATQFHKIVSPIFQLIRDNSLEAVALEQMRDLLLPKLMNGGIRTI